MSRTYLTGTIEFYAKLPGNPWQKAHDDFEAATLKIQADNHYTENMQVPLANFQSTLLDLIERFRPFSPGAKGSPESLGLFSNSVGEAEARQSCTDRICPCGAKKNLRIVRHPQHGLGIYCQACLMPEQQGERE